MANDRIVEDADVERWAAESIPVRFPLWSRARIGLAIGSVVLLAWLPPSGKVRTVRPAHHTPGISPNPIVRFAFAPDSRTIATVDDHERIELRRLDGSSPTIPIDGTGHVKAIAFSPDGRLLVIGRREPDVVLVELEGSVSTRTLGIDVKNTSDLACSPDGRLLAVASHESSRIVVWDLAAGRERTILAGHRTPAQLVRFTPDGRSLVSLAINDHRLLFWDLAIGRPIRRLENFATRPNCLAYSPDGRCLATSCAPQSVQIWDLETCREVVRIAELGFPARSLVFSPDDRLLAVAAGDGSASLWNAVTGQPIRRLETGLDVLNDIAFSPDGRLIALGGNDGSLRLWDVATLLAASDGSD